jgi:ligand-binding sensor domain-containing protein/DNA-binding CsgD family transcriptional regulator
LQRKLPLGPILKKIISILILFCYFTGFGQIKNIGTPNIIKYPKSVYKAGTQNWGITQDENGFMYFANNEGVLIFNGLEWQRVEVVPAKPIRSIFRDSKNNIYIGFLNDFGVLQQNEKGLLSFKSLRPLLPDEIGDFNDIWKIHEIPEGIVFQTFEYFFLLSDDQIKVVEPEQRFYFSFNVNGRLLLHEPNIGVSEYINGALRKVSGLDELKDREIWEMLSIRDDYLLICTRGHGIFKLANGKLEKWETPVNSMVEEYKLYSAINIEGNYFAFGTILNGLFISDFDGNIVQHINNTKGLQNNTVLSLYADINGNLWAGLDIGIDFIELNSPITYLIDSKEMGTGYCACVHDNKLYLGTNQGLFVKPFNEFLFTDDEFVMVENTAGQVWSLDVFDDQLICGHHSGTFLVRETEATQISKEEGGWKYIALKNHPDLLLGGHYDGLVLLKNGLDGWMFHKKIKGFYESCRFLEQSDDSDIWVSHGASGIFRINLANSYDSVLSYTLYHSGNGLPSDENNIVFSLFDEIIVSTIDGIYQFDKTTDDFKKSDKFVHIFDFDGRINALETDKWDNLWYISGNELGVMRLNEENKYTKISLPFAQLDGKFVNGFEFIYPFNNKHVIIGIDNGFAHYSSNYTKLYNQPFKAFITSVELPYIDSVINFYNVSKNQRNYKFPFNKNHIKFYFTSPFYENPQNLKFSYFLEGFSDEWSDWSPNNFNELTNLPDGNYRFIVKSKNLYGIESEISHFDFTITPPWYRSLIATFIYIVTLGFLIFIAIKVLQTRIKKSKTEEKLRYLRELKKKDEQYEHQAGLSEREINKLRNDKLRTEMIHRDKELANQTMNIVQKNKFILKIKEELAQINKSTQNPEVKIKLDLLGQKLDREIDNKQQYKVFETYFEEAHEEFFSRIKEKHPQLSPRELHLCAYLRMNLSTKEIATLLNISVRGVEISRYRLRKKLELSPRENLSIYITNI